MMIITDIKCPLCKRKFKELCFWRQVGDEYFHLCEECKNKPLSTDDILIIGEDHGRRALAQDVHNFLRGAVFNP